MEECTSLTREQCEFACQMFGQWMRICEDNKRGTRDVDVGHSALLRRLLLGGNPHKNPPPLRMSYPAWELVERDEIEIHDLFDSIDRVIYGEKDEKLYEGPVVVVDQHAAYAWEDKEKQILRHVRLGILYQYSEREVTPDARYLAKGLNPEDHKYVGKFLKRLNDPPTGKEEIWK